MHTDKQKYRLLLAFLSGCICIHPLLINAQQIGQNAETQGPATFQTTTQLVIETVTVKDKSGSPVEGLTAKDFTVTEDGAPQAIRFFEFQKFEEAGRTPIAPDERQVQPLTKYPHAQIAPETPGDIRYRNRRLMALYFDMNAMPVPDQLRAFDAAQKFIRTQMTASDLMAIMLYQGSGVQVLQDFTGDRDRILTVIATLIVGEDQNSGDTTNDDSTPDTGAAFGQDDSEFNIFNTDRQLSALQTAAKMLGSLNEKKSLIYFASGLKLERRRQPGATSRHHQRRDPRGRVVLADRCARPCGASPAGRCHAWVARRRRHVHRRIRHGVHDHFQQSQDTLWALAADTGGKALLDYNDLAKECVQAAAVISSYYIIGYYTTNPNLDGKFRRIKISLSNGLTANLDYRQGYFAGKQFAKFTTAEKERQLEDALMLGDPITELTIAHGGGLLPVEPRRVFRSAGGENSRKGTGASQARRRGTYVA